MQSISQEFRALGTTMTIKDAKVEDLRVAVLARGGSIVLL
jgi:hypothetical protein